MEYLHPGVPEGLMHCPSCQHENPAGARFCNACGTRLEAVYAEVYGWFSEGFDTADLQEARALLAELAGAQGERQPPDSVT